MKYVIDLDGSSFHAELKAPSCSAALLKAFGDYEYKEVKGNEDYNVTVICNKRFRYFFVDFSKKPK